MALRKGATIFGGGGFLFDTSTDGADSISLAGNLSASSMIQANGGNDTIHRPAASSNPLFTVVKALTTSLVVGGKSISGSVIEGNLGADTIIFNSTNSVFNTEVYGSNSSGTDTAADSIEIAARNRPNLLGLWRCWW